MDDDDNVVTFRSSGRSPVPPPPLPPAPQPRVPVFAGATAQREQGGGPGIFSNLPTVDDMAPPFALAMPGLPAVASDNDDSSGDTEEGAFAPPAPEDPDHPTARDTLAVCMALLTALGVAAAQGMWHRVRHRQALADQARATADKATAKAGKRRGGGDSGGSSGRSHGGGRKLRGSDRPAGNPHASKNGPGRGKDGGKRSKGPRLPKAGGSGKPSWGRDKSKRRKDKPGKGWLKRRPANDSPAKKTPKPDKPAPGAGGKGPKSPRKPGGLRWRAPKRRKGDGKDPKGWTSGRPGKSRKNKPESKRRADRVRWKAARIGPGPGGDKAIDGRKRWKRVPRPGDKAARRRFRTSWVRKPAKRGVRWLKRWKKSRRPSSPWTFEFTWPNRSPGKHRGAWPRWWTRRRRANSSAWSAAGASPPPPPPPGFGGMRPPPAADQTVWATAERVDQPGRPQREPAPEPVLVLAGAPAGGRPALPGPTPAVAAQTNGARFMSTSPATTQYRDAELTIYDVIEADADMAEEIMAGVDEARATADGCEQLVTKLEAVRARIIELKVPGVLAMWMVRLLEKTATVKASAQEIAARLPAASEAIATAGSNAAAIYQPPADVTRDMGHTRPADREYHND